MEHLKQRFKDIETHLTDCVSLLQGYNEKLILSSNEPVALLDAKKKIKYYNDLLKGYENDLLSLVSVIPSTEQEQIAKESEIIRNPDSTPQQKSGAKEKVIKLFSTYGRKIVEIGGSVALALLLRSLGLTLVDLGLTDN